MVSRIMKYPSSGNERYYFEDIKARKEGKNRDRDCETKGRIMEYRTLRSTKVQEVLKSKDSIYRNTESRSYVRLNITENRRKCVI